MFMDLRPESAQKMMLTPKMLLSMHVLQLNIMDLRVFMRAELEENPLLEEETQSELLDEVESKLDEEISRSIDGDIRDENYPSTNDENFTVSKEKKRYFESLITKRESLYEHLYWQLEVLAKDDEQKRIGEFIIGNLDDNGYLKIDFKEVQDTLAVSSRDVKSALSLIRSLDPVGVGARNLRESLLIQLIHAGKGNTNLHRIVYSYLEDLEKGNYEKIAKVLSITVKEVELAKKRISYLNPRPGANFGRVMVFRIIPDVFLDKNNGSFDTKVNEEDLPKVTVSRSYVNILKNKKTDELTKKYIRNKLLGAQWLIDAVKQRKNTLMRICEYLVEIQKDFLHKGDSAIKPLILKEVAEALSISEATVSRVVSNKYAQIVNRLIALKSFFAGKIKTVDGKFVSDKVIKQEIQDLIEAEDTSKPLSDEAITAIINKKGIKVSRRTVAKYRDRLKILPFNLRKR